MPEKIITPERIEKIKKRMKAVKAVETRRINSSTTNFTHKLSEMPVFSIQDIEDLFILSFDVGVYWNMAFKFLTEVINIKQEVLTEKQLNWLWRIKTDLSSNRALTQLESIRRRVRNVF